MGWLNYNASGVGEVIDRFRWENGCIVEHVSLPGCIPKPLLIYILQVGCGRSLASRTLACVDRDIPEQCCLTIYHFFLGMMDELR